MSWFITPLKLTGIPYYLPIYSGAVVLLTVPAPTTKVSNIYTHLLPVLHSVNYCRLLLNSLLSVSPPKTIGLVRFLIWVQPQSKKSVFGNWFWRNWIEKKLQKLSGFHGKSIIVKSNCFLIVRQFPSNYNFILRRSYLITLFVIFLNRFLFFIFIKCMWTILHSEKRFTLGHVHIATFLFVSNSYFSSSLFLYIGKS